MRGSAKQRASSRKVALVTTLTALLIIGVGTAVGVSPGFLLQIDGGGGLVTDPGDSDENNLTVVDLRVDKTSVAVGEELDMEAVVANYNNEDMTNVELEPMLFEKDGGYNHDSSYNIEPSSSETFDIEAGEVKSFSFVLTIEDNYNNYPVERYMVLTDGDSAIDEEDMPVSERTLNIVKEGSSSSGSGLSDRDPTSIATFKPDAFKDGEIAERDSPLAQRDIPPLTTYDDGTINRDELTEVPNGVINDISSILGDGSGTSIESSGEPLNIGLKYESIPKKQNYEFTLKRSPGVPPDSQEVSDQEVEIKFVDAKSREIDKHTDYYIPPVDGTVEEVSYHLSDEEASYIRNQEEAYVQIVSESGIRINGIQSANTNSSDELAGVPDPNLKLESVEVEDMSQPYESESGDQMRIKYEINNTGDGAANRMVGLLEDEQLNAVRDTRELIVNPGSTETIEFVVPATPEGTHNYQLNDDEISTAGVNDEVSVAVGDTQRRIIPNPIVDVEEPIVGETNEYEIGGIFEDDYDRINEIRWQFGNEDSRTINGPVSESDLTVEHAFEEQGRNVPVNVQVDYQQNGDTLTSEDTLLLDVAERPEPDLEAVYYDVSIGSRTQARSGQAWGSGSIGGELVSGSCQAECSGSLSIGGYDLGSLNGLSMAVVKENFSKGSAELVHYSTYNFNTGQVAETDNPQDFQIDDTDGSAVSKFRENVNVHSDDEGKYLIFVGTGDPMDDARIVEQKLQQLGAEQATSIAENDPYTYVVKSTGNDNKPMHESHLPSRAGEELEHQISIQPVKTNEDLPEDYPVYINLVDSTGSNYYERNDLERVEFSEGDEGEYAKVTVSGEKTVSVEIDAGDEFDVQRDEITLNTAPVNPSVSIESTESVIDTDEEVFISAADSYYPDGRISEGQYNWNVLEAPEDANYQTDGQYLRVEAGEDPGVFEATVSVNGVESGKETILLSTGVNADFDVDRRAGSYDYEGTSGSAETIYSFGEPNRINEVNLDTLVQQSDDFDNPVEAFGEGEVQFNSDHIYVRADASTEPSASRFLETEPINMANYDKIYLAYERSFDRSVAGGNTETGYVSMHLSDISVDNYRFGNEGTLRGTEVDTVMTSDVVTGDMENTRGNVIELDVSGVNSQKSVKIHTRAHSSNGGTAEVRIYEMWADRDTGQSLGQVFDNNFYPQNMQGTTIQGIKSGFMVTGASSGGSDIGISDITGSNIQAEYSVDPRTNAQISLTSGGSDIRQDEYTGEVTSNLRGSNLKLSSDHSFGRFLVSDELSAYVDKQNSQYPTVRLDAGPSAATSRSTFEWSVEDAEVQDSSSSVTHATFFEPGEDKTIQLRVEGSRGEVSTHEETVDVDPLPPEIEMNLPDSANPGRETGIFVSADSGENTASVQEVKLLMGNGDVITRPTGGEVTYTYDNPGRYEVTAVLKDEFGRTSATSGQIVVDQPTGELLEGNVEEDVLLPTNVVIDPTGEVTRPSDEFQPAKVLDVSSRVVADEDNLQFSWIVDGQTVDSRVLEYETESVGDKQITLVAEDNAGRQDSITVTLRQEASSDIIENVEIQQDSVEAYKDDLEVEIQIDQEATEGTEAIITMPDGREFTEETAFRGTESAVLSVGSLRTDVSNLGQESTVRVRVENTFDQADSATDTVVVEAPEPSLDISVAETIDITGESTAEHSTYLAEPITLDIEAYNPHPQIGGSITMTSEDGTRTEDINIPSGYTSPEDAFNREYQYELDPSEFDADDFPVSDSIAAEFTDSQDQVAEDGTDLIEVYHRGITIEDFYAINDLGERTTDVELGAETEFTGEVTAPDSNQEYKFEFWDDESSGWTDENTYIRQFVDTSPNPSAILNVRDEYGFSAEAEINFNLEIRESCLRIQQNNDDPPSGLYYVVPIGYDTPVQVQCDMEKDGGGWTLVLSADGDYADGPTDVYPDQDWASPDQFSSSNANFGELNQPSDGEGWKISDGMINAIADDGRGQIRATTFDLQNRRFFNAGSSTYQHDRNVVDAPGDATTSYQSTSFNNVVDSHSPNRGWELHGITDSHYPDDGEGYSTSHNHKKQAWVDSETAIWVR